MFDFTKDERKVFHAIFSLIFIFDVCTTIIMGMIYSVNPKLHIILVYAASSLVCAIIALIFKHIFDDGEDEEKP